MESIADVLQRVVEVWRYHGKVSRCLGELLKRYQEGGGGNLLHPCRGESSRRVV